jgi:hypothetical protein
MFNFYRGELKLKEENVQAIGSALANEHSAHYAKEKPEWFDRFVQQTLYFYSDPSRMKNPITILLANGYMHGVHPGSSRFLGCYLAGVDTMPVLAVSHVDPSTPRALEKYLVNYELTDDYEFYTEGPCKNSFQPKTRNDIATDDNWIEKDSIEEVNKKVLWNRHPNLQWINYQNEVLFERVTDASAVQKKIVINDFHEFWDSLKQLIIS